MTKQEIIERCIAAYSEAIEVCKELELDEAKNWLDKKELNIGVCYYSKIVLDFKIYYEKWIIRNFMPSRLHWSKRPYDCNTHPELMESLTTRLQILQHELSIPE